jgi:phosphatidylglycerol---prolipoprotein diacylglyceryl transferase
MNLAYIPSPGQGVWDIGPLPIRAYALCILLGVVVAIVVGERRWVARGGRPGTVGDIAIWAVPFGLVGARLYHVVTDPELYFGSGKDPWAALYIWKGGLGVWGAIAFGALGGYLACRRRGIPFPAVADALAPSLALAQAIGRWGNYFNQELYGRPSTLPWAVEIDPANREDGYEKYATYHPTFLYESLWCLGVAGLVIWADRRFRLGHGRAFALYVMAYTVGRVWIEDLRVDTANHVLGLRLNEFTCLVLFVLAAVYFVISAKRRPGREVVVQPGWGDADHADDRAEGEEDGETAEPGSAPVRAPADGPPDEADKGDT